jgi:hypothetical protein
MTGGGTYETQVFQANRSRVHNLGETKPTNCADYFYIEHKH